MRRVFLDDPLLFAAHQINIELRHAQCLQFFELSDLRLDIPQNAETIDDVFFDEVKVISIFVGVMAIVVPLAPFDVVSQALGDEVAFLAVFFNEIGDVIADHRREPARLRPRCIHVTDPHRRCDMIWKFDISRPAATPASIA